MKHFDLSSKNRLLPHWAKFALAGVMVAALAGCGGGSDGATGATGPQGPAGAQGPAGSNAVVTTNVGSNATAATAAAAAAWKALAPQVTVTGVTVASAPVVTFTVKDAAGNAVVGLGNKAQSSSATVANLTNLGFTLAKLVPAANGEPSKWVSYNILKPVTVAQAAGTISAADSCNKTATAAATWCGTFPTTDTQGTLVDNGDGSYKYTFYRDPKQVKDLAAGLTDSADGLTKKADLGDLTFDGNLTHRLGILISGNAPGTGTNTPTAVASATAAAAIANPANSTYDFIPATGKAVTATDASRNIVNINTCGSCHQSKPLAHGGSRGNPELCVTCHTDQVKYTFNLAAGIPMDANGNLTGGITGSTAQKRAEQAILDGRAVGNFPNYMHKLHMGTKLTKKGYNYNVDNGPMLFNQNQYPQDIRNCTTCHDGAATGAKATKDGDNWKKVPSQLACGSCHDGINFATGTGTALGVPGKTVGGHVGGAQATNATCATCHAPADIVTYHPGSPTMPATAVAAKRTLSATIKSVSIPADGSVTVNFSLVNNGVPVTAASDFSGLAFTLAKLVPAVDGRSTQWVSYLARARSKDAAMVPVIQGYSELALGQTATAPSATAAGRPALVGGTLTAGATAGDWSYKFALVNGAGNINNVTTAQNVSAFVNAGSDYNFTKVATYPNRVSYDATLTHRVGMEVSTAAGVNNLTNATLDFRPAGGAVATTRNIVTMDNCATCHAGRKIHKAYATQYCVTCHNQNTADPYYGDQTITVDLQNLVHKIHDRGADYTVNGEEFGSAASGNAGFPGLVQNCQVCHVETNAAAKDAANWRTMPNSRSCATCHDDNPLAVAHMNLQISGGTGTTAAGLKTGGVETCVVCHGPNSTIGVDVKTIHAKFGSVVSTGK